MFNNTNNKEAVAKARRKGGRQTKFKRGRKTINQIEKVLEKTRMKDHETQKDSKNEG